MAIFFTYVSIAGVARHTVAAVVDCFRNVSPAAWLNKNIAVRKKASAVTERQKKDGECVKMKKPWMMHLQHLIPAMLRLLGIRILLVSAADFVENQEEL